ncbi:MAG TPA: hypothetical protein VFI76_04550 [Terrimicrobiaceae bacterium]|nr:hypothetical protein [Terrimicrobiaceae bacterium]
MKSDRVDMDATAQRQRARQHLQDGESLVADLRGFIAEQRMAGRSTRDADRLLQQIEATLDRLRDCSR